MKTYLIFLCLFFISSFTLFAQTIQKESVKIKVLENEYMFARGFVEEKIVKKTEVKFTPEIVKVFIPYNNNVITLEILNSDCKAYCPVVKRIRQLTPKDDKLLKNVIEKEKANILAQLKAKGVKF